jgi:dihydrofolate reductase
MRTVVLHVFDYSLDGILGEEGTEFAAFCRETPDDPASKAWLGGCLDQAEAHIMGRVTFEGMAAYFPGAEDHPYAAIMNSARKAVFSRTLPGSDWSGTTILRGDLATELGKLRQEGDGEIIAHGGVSFARSLVRLDLVDEFRLQVFPFLAGSGQALFADVDKPRDLELVSSTPFGNQTVAMTYRRKRGWQPAG